jgi:hypothetical protein
MLEGQHKRDKGAVHKPIFDPLRRIPILLLNERTRKAGPAHMGR